MNHEVLLFLHSFGIGMLLTVVYDFLKIFREFVSHGKVLLSVEDVLFWLCSGFYAFSRIYQENDGIVRIYVFVAMFLGCGLWKFTVESAFITFFLRILKVPVKFLRFLTKWLLFLGGRCKILMCRLVSIFGIKCYNRVPGLERNDHSEGKEK